jgi:hypothetical protein
MNKLACLSFAGIATLLATPGLALADTLNACVNRSSGEIKAVAPGEGCTHNSFPVSLRTGPEPPATGTTLQIEYFTGGIYPGTSVARAFCPSGTKVLGGGGITTGYGFGLQQSYPISDESGLIAWGGNAIGWQAAADDFGFAQAFVICAH